MPWIVLPGDLESVFYLKIKSVNEFPSYKQIITGIIMAPRNEWINWSMTIIEISRIFACIENKLTHIY